MADPLSVACPDCYAPAGTDCRLSISYLEGHHAARQRSADLNALERGTCALCGKPMVRGSVEGSPVDAWHYQPEDAAACPPIPNPSTHRDAWAAAVNAGLEPGHPGVEHFIPAGRYRCPHGELLTLEPAIGCGCFMDPGDPRAAALRDTDSAGVPLADQPPGTWERADYEGGDPDEQSYAQRERDELLEEGRRLASERDNLIAAGVDPSELAVPAPITAPDPCPECAAGKHGNCDGTAWSVDEDCASICPCAAADHPGPAPRVATHDPFSPNPPPTGGVTP